jgi:hypothetical protein
MCINPLLQDQSQTGLKNWLQNELKGNKTKVLVLYSRKDVSVKLPEECGMDISKEEFDEVVTKYQEYLKGYDPAKETSYKNEYLYSEQQALVTDINS